MTTKIKTKSLNEIWQQMDYIRSCFPDWMPDEEFEDSWLRKAYDIAGKYTQNCGEYLWEKYRAGYSDHLYDQIPREIYAKQNSY